MEDSMLLRLLQKDADRGLEAALELYGGLVKTIVSRVLRDFPEDAEECMSDVFLKLWRERKKLRGKPVRAWLIVTARNAAIDRWRTLTKNAPLPLDEEYSDTVMTAEEKIGPIIDSMPPPDREIFIRKYYFLETAAEIAEAMGRTPEDIHQRLSRGRRRVKEQLTKGESFRYAERTL